MSTLGKKIAKFRTERGLSLKEMAKTVGISFSYLSAIERGTKNPSLEVTRKLAKAMNVPLSYLFSEPAKDTLAGAKLRLIREGRKISLEDLAEFSGISVQRLSAFESGTEDPSLNEIELLADILDVTPQYFIQDAANTVGIGRRISATRKGRGWSQNELAKRAAISVSLLSQIENEKAVPSLDTLERIAAALELSVCYFLLDQEEIVNLLSSLSPDVLESLHDPRVQAFLRAIRDFDSGELRFVLNQITFLKKNFHLVQ